MNFNLAVVAGDGIGPEVMEQNIYFFLGGVCYIDKSAQQ